MGVEIVLIPAASIGVVLLILAVYFKMKSAEEGTSWIKKYPSTLWKRENMEEWHIGMIRVRTFNAILGVLFTIGTFLFLIPLWWAYTSSFIIPVAICILVPYFFIFVSFTFLLSAVKNVVPFGKGNLKYIAVIMLMIFIGNIYLPYIIINPDGSINRVSGYRTYPAFMFSSILGTIDPIIAFIIIYAIIPAVIISISYLIYTKFRISSSKTMAVSETWKGR